MCPWTARSEAQEQLGWWTLLPEGQLVVPFVHAFLDWLQRRLYKLSSR